MSAELDVLHTLAGDIFGRMAPDAISSVRQAVIPSLMRDEGHSLKPYRCSAGKLSIGYGRNLEDVGITEDEAMALLEHDVDSALADCLRAFPWFPALDAVRQGVVVQLVFNMGLPRVLGFKNTLAAIARGDYDAAANGLRRSRWATQVGARADRLIAAMRTGRTA